MIRLYKQKEVLFAVLCIAAYVVILGNLRTLGDDSPYMMLGLIVFAGLLFIFIKKNGLTAEYGLDRWTENSRQMLYFIPMWIFTTGNLWGGITLKYQGYGLICSVISFALVGFVEELLFRGFLFRAMLKSGNAKAAVIVSAVTFGMGHIVNILTGHGNLETLLQMIFAVAVGFVFTYVFYKGESLLPVILSHSLIDVFSVFSNRSKLADWIYIGVTIAISVIYCIYLSRLNTPAVKKS